MTDENDNTDLPSTVTADYAKRLMAGIAASRAATPLSGGGLPFLKMVPKRGDWVFGPEEIEVQKGSRWVVNATNLQHGYCCWIDAGNKRELAGQTMTNVLDPKPAKPDPVQGTEYRAQCLMQLKCLDGDDAGREVIYSNNSDGGLKAFDALIAEIGKRLMVDHVHCCPVIELKTESYDHPKYKETFTPLFAIVGWADVRGNLAPAKPVPKLSVVEDAAPAAPPEPARGRGRRAVDSDPSAAQTAPLPPQSTVAAHAGQRRRPPR